MRPIILSLCLLLVIGVLFSTGLQEYFYEGENQTGSESFSALEASYEIIYIDGEEAFLLKNGEILDNEPEIEAALYQYYVTQYYPSQAEIGNISALLQLYHDSRENGDMWANVEEEECRMGIFLHAFPCTNESIPTTLEESRGNDCYLTASVLCDEYGDYLGCSDPIMIMPLLQDFAISSNRMTEIHDKTVENLANLTEANIYDVFLELKDDIDAMREYEQKLEETLLRVPYTSGGDSCNECYGICPPIIIDEEHLDAVEEKLDELLPNLEYIGEYEFLAVKIYNSTMERKEYQSINKQTEQYIALYAPEKTRAEEVLADADELLEYVSDDTVLTNSERVQQIMDTIDEDTNASDFSTIDANLDELDAKLNVLTSSIASSWEIYNTTVIAKEGADALFFTLETKDLSEDAAAEFTALKAEKRTQDRSFVDGLSPEKFEQITEAYNSLSGQASTLLGSSQGSEMIVDTFKGAGVKTNAGIAGLASTMVPLEREDREEVSGYAPILVSSLSFFSISSLAVFIFLFAFATFSNVFRNKIMLFLGILLLGCSILFAGVVSGGIYYVLASSSTDASFTDFQSYVLSSNHVSIIVESEDVPSGASAQMLSCAQELAGSLEGKDVVIYKKTNSECIINGQNVTLAECYNSVEEPIIMFHYTTVAESPQFSTGFVYKGTFSGDEEYFSECQVAKGFIQVDLNGIALAAEPANATESLNEGMNTTETE